MILSRAKEVMYFVILRAIKKKKIQGDIIKIMIEELK